jgi:hypothetical protein
MELMKRSQRGLFASESLAGHVLRGAIGIALLAWAVLHQSSMLLSMAAGIGALLALRGCPVCWTIGLIETVMQRFQSRTQRNFSKT